MKYVFVVPIAISVNGAYRYTALPNGHIIQVKTKEYNDWANAVRKLLPEHLKGMYAARKQTTWTMHLAINCGHQRDISNCYKATEDVVGKFMGLDDAWNECGGFLRARDLPGVEPGFMQITMNVHDEGPAPIVNEAPVDYPALQKNLDRRKAQKNAKRRKLHQSNGEEELAEFDLATR